MADLRGRLSQVIEAVGAGERVVLTRGGRPVADVVAHHERSRWIPGDVLRRRLADRAADPGMDNDLEALGLHMSDEPGL